MPAVLRPMKLGEILDQGFSLYRRNLLKLAATTALPALILISLHVADYLWIHLALGIGRPADKMDAWGLGFLVWLIYSHVAAFLHPLFYPAVIKVTTGVLFGEPVSAAGALRFNARRWRRYLWVDVLRSGAVPLLPEAVGFGLIAALAFADDRFDFDPNGNLLSVTAILVAVAVIATCCWLGASLSFAIPAAALEDVGGFKAIERSRRLSKGVRFQVFVTWILTFFLILFLWFVLELILRGVGTFMYGTLHLHFVNGRFYLVSYYIVGAVYAAIVEPIYPVLLVLLYLNQRVRKEGYDVERMIEAAGLVVPFQEPVGEKTGEPAAAEAVSASVDGANVESAGESMA